MNRLDIAAVAAAVALSFSAGAVAAQGMTKDEYKAGKDRIAAEYKSARASCQSQVANAKDICIAEAKGAEKVARAELEARNRPGDRTRYAVSVAKAEADYGVAKEKCDDKAAEAKKTCVKDAKAAESRAKADAKAQMKAAGASQPAKRTTAASTSGKQSPGEFIDDSVITAKVKAAVLDEPSLKSAEINVETSKGRVQLSGFVRSRANIDKAVEVAKGVNGVKSVKNDMILKGTQ